MQCVKLSNRNGNQLKDEDANLETKGKVLERKRQRRATQVKATGCARLDRMQDYVLGWTLFVFSSSKGIRTGNEHRSQSKGIESAVRRLRIDRVGLFQQSRSFEWIAAAHALFVCLDVAHLAAIRAFALCCLGLASASASGIGGGGGWGFVAVDGGGHADVDAGDGGAGGGACEGVGRGGDSFGLFALVAPLAVFL